MKNALSIILFILLGMLIIGCSTTVIKTDERKDIGLCEKICGSDDDCKSRCSSLECEEGYTVAAIPLYGPGPNFYCRIDKEWTDFIPCNKAEDCDVNYGCVSRIKHKRDYRCIPNTGYLMSCTCSLEGDCICS